jgi:hypothetical protein
LLACLCLLNLARLFACVLASAKCFCPALMLVLNPCAAVLAPWAYTPHACFLRLEPPHPVHAAVHEMLFDVHAQG